MFCSVYKWLISQATTSGKHVSKPVQHHIQKCDSCREYFQFCESLRQRGRHDASALMGAHDKRLDKTIIPFLSKAKAPSPMPTHKPALVPVIAVVFFVAALSISLLLLRPQQEKATPLDDISKLVSAAAPDNVLMKLESPLENEYLQLKQTLNSTTKFLFSRLDIRLGQQAQ